MAFLPQTDGRFTSRARLAGIGTPTWSAPISQRSFSRRSTTSSRWFAPRGGGTEHIVKLLAFVTDLDQYRAAQQAIGEGWRARMGRYYPAMSLVKVAGLLEPGALVEIEGVAMLPGDAR